MDWYEVKETVSAFSGLSMDALHVHAGVLLQLLAAFLLRRSLASPWPWLIVLLATVLNEWSDLVYEIWPTRHEQYGESIADAWNTMLLPTVLLFLARYAPHLLTGLDRPSAGAETAPAE